MTGVVKFEAELKQRAGTGTARAVRRLGLVPAVVYGAGQSELMLSLPLKDLEREYLKGGFKTKLIELQLGKETINAIPKDIQLHPVSDKPIHVDFLRVNKDTTVRVAVTVKVINEDKAPGVKKGGIVNIVHRSIELTCHPTDIPHHLEVDITGMEIGQNVHIKDVKLPSGVTPYDKSNFTVVSITGRSNDEEKAAAQTEAAPTAGATATAAPAAAKPTK